MGEYIINIMSKNISDRTNFIYIKTNDKIILLIKNTNNATSYSLKYPNTNKLNILNDVKNNKNYKRLSKLDDMINVKNKMCISRNKICLNKDCNKQPLYNQNDK